MTIISTLAPLLKAGPEAYEAYQDVAKARAAIERGREAYRLCDGFVRNRAMCAGFVRVSMVQPALFGSLGHLSRWVLKIKPNNFLGLGGAVGED